VSAVTLNDHVVIEILCNMLLVDFKSYAIASVVCLLQKLIWVGRVLLDSVFDELLSHHIVDVKQIVSIFPSIF
jgi:hypothetical protein